MLPARRLVRLLAAVGVCAGATLLAAPLDAHHSIDFDSYDCSAEPSPSPDVEEPELTPAPTEAPEGQEPPPPGEEPTPAPQNCMPAEGERIWGVRNVRFGTTTDGARPLKRVALSILSEEESIPHANGGKPLLEETYARGDDVRAYDTPFAWNSAEVTPRNGKYRIKVDVDTYPAVTGQQAHGASRERTKLRVDNPPKPVGAPKVLVTTSSSVTLQWEAAPEPDVLSYTVYRATTKSSTRKPPYSAFKEIGRTTGPAFRDGTVKPGAHWYTVRVTRRSVVTPDEGISSTMSAMSGTTVKKPEVRDDDDDGQSDGPPRLTRYRQLAPPQVSSRLAAVPDAPFAYQLPFDDSEIPESAFEGSSDEEPGGTDPRGPVLPVAVGMFLVSSALAVGRMPY